MPAQLVDGTAVARQVREDVAKGVAELAAAGGDPPGLATVLIGDDPASEVYVRNKRRACVGAGIRDLDRHLPSSVSQGDARRFSRSWQPARMCPASCSSCPSQPTWTSRSCSHGSRQARTWTASPQPTRAC